MTPRITPYSGAKVLSSATVPPGTYVVGDPCYAIPDDVWMEWLEAAEYTTPSREHVLAAEIDGHLAVGVCTAYGDGCYRGSDGNDYPVDAGLIGLVPVEVAVRDNPSNTVTFTSPAECHYDNGVIHLGHITINTGDEDEDEGDGW